jgi:hypothetical protein
MQEPVLLLLLLLLLFLLLLFLLLHGQLSPTCRDASRAALKVLGSAGRLSGFTITPS